MSRILIIDDEPAIRRTLREILEMENYNIDDAENGAQALKKLNEHNYDIILCDIKMPGMDGMELLKKMLDITSAAIIMISGHGTIDNVVEALKLGAFDYIQKPLDLNRLLTSIRNALERNSLVRETKLLRRKVGEKTYQIIGQSAAMQHVREMIERVAPTDARILICGESGTGKELVARAIHQKSKRANAAFVEVNCAAIPSELIESQLFGHEKGSFTSAIKTRKGDFELADNGTLFLDEIGDMSLSAQAKVLRALQENKIVRVGGEKEIPVNVRVIAATNKNLEEEIRKGNFREDLYHRLSVIIIHVPPLRERLDDIPLLVDYFTEEISQSEGKPKPQFDREAIKQLQSYPWTGNIRELRNVVERLHILGGTMITKVEVEKYVHPILK